MLLGIISHDEHVHEEEHLGSVVAGAGLAASADGGGQLPVPPPELPPGEPAGSGM